MVNSEIKSICEAYGIRPSKSKGQNFLIDKNIIKKIIAGAGLKRSDKVLEIGPGLGVLTEELLRAADRVTAVELDERVIKYLKQSLAGELAAGNFVLLEGDALKINYRACGFADFDFKIVANLPYSITANFFRQFLELGPKPEEIIVMIQKEVADRLVAKPGNMSLLALSAQLFAEPEILFTVSPQSFWPAPEVTSAVVKLILKKDLGGADPKKIFRLAKMGFAAKRKQLHNNLAGGLGLNNDEVKAIFKELGWREDIRAQDLGVEDWIKLSAKIGK